MNRTLIIVDIQNDFLKGGKLSIRDSNSILEPVMQLLRQNIYDRIIVTMDWHPFDHCSFEEWGEHCVEYSAGACMPDELERLLFEINKNQGNVEYLFKGNDSDKEEYSAFYNYPDISLDIDDIYEAEVVGLALDYCVKETALDLNEIGVKVIVNLDCCMGTCNESSIEARQEMEESGITFIGTLKNTD